MVRNQSSPIEKFRATWFPRREDAIWKEWVDMERRNRRSLCDLLADPAVRETFKARALMVLLSPSLANVPVYWRGEYAGRSMLENSWVNLEGLSDALLNFATELLICACEALQEERGDGDSLTRVRWSCNSQIMQLLSMLPIEASARLWPYFLINDPAAYYNMDDASGYGPWRSLMWDAGIPMPWKSLADSQFRQIIEQELAGQRKPREEWEVALRCYINHVASLVFAAGGSGQLSYDVDLLASQLDYILSKGVAVIGREVIPSFSMKAALRLLELEEYRLVRNRLIEFVVTHPEYPFRIHTEEDLRVAETMLASAIGYDGDLVAVQLRQLIETSRPHVEQRQRAALQLQTRRQGVLSQMKTS